jgi:hypothetical protein
MKPPSFHTLPGTPKGPKIPPLDREVDWFTLSGGQYQRLAPDGEGWLKSRVFPGLWLDVPALIEGNLARVLAVVQQGIASPENAEFVARLHRVRSSS